MSYCVKTGLTIWHYNEGCGWRTDAHYLPRCNCLVFTGCTGDRALWENHLPDLIIDSGDYFLDATGSLVVPAADCTVCSDTLREYWERDPRLLALTRFGL